MSTVLGFSSAREHSHLAAAVHGTMQTWTPQSLREAASQAKISEAGRRE